MKKCSTCLIEKDLISFELRPGTSDGLRGQCKDCRRPARAEQARKYRERYPEKARSAMLKWKENNPERIEYHNKQRRFKARGLAEKTYLEMVLSQNNRCMICNDLCDHLNIDHDHDTNKVRDLLCGPCNRGLGHFRDSIDLLYNAQQYLMRHKLEVANNNPT